MANTQTSIPPTVDQAAAELARALAVLIAVASRPPAPTGKAPTVITAPDGRIFYGVKEAARLLSVSVTVVNKLLYSGALLSVKVGSRRLIPAAELDRYAAELADQARAAYGAGLVLR